MRKLMYQVVRKVRIIHCLFYMGNIVSSVSTKIDKQAI